MSAGAASLLVPVIVFAILGIIALVFRKFFVRLAVDQSTSILNPRPITERAAMRSTLIAGIALLCFALGSLAAFLHALVS